MKSRNLFVALASSVCIVTMATPAQAQTREYRIPAGSLKAALDAYARQSGRQIIYKADDLRAVRSPGVRGYLSADSALLSLLRGTGFSYRADSSGAVAIVAGEADAGSAPADQSAEIVVTGSRVRGAAVAAPITTVSQAQMRQAGQTDLGAVVRSIPQNFNGGQNPGVAFGASANPNNANVTGGSSINLRGLGPDATLTLLNGRRLSYGSASQAVDVSAIPIAAVDRIEIVADGASAIYGSDAVAGVANVILKRDYNGVATTARLGTATDGGNFQQQYNVVGGAVWGTGGFIATYDFERDTAIRTDQRDYTSYVLSPQTILPLLKRHSVLASAHQELLPGVRFSIDGLYNRRWADSAQTLTTSTNRTNRSAENWVVSPVLEVRLPPQWSMTLSGTYGQDDVVLDQPSFTRAGVLRSRTRYCLCNTIKGAELGVEGSLLNLPAGAIRIAAGGGYRENLFDQRFFTSTSRVSGRQQSYFAFGELYVPVISPDQQVAFASRLSLTGALRHEDYSTFGGVTTPKLGIVYAPIAGIELKGSWGRSFKAPTLLQQNDATFALLFPASSFGVTGAPAGTSVLVGFGGNQALRPERATTWSATLALRPAFASGLSTDISYFNVRYRDRVVEAVGDLFSALANPIYGEFLIRNPSTTQQQVIIDRAGASNFINYTGVPYNSASVSTIVNDYSVNAAAQHISGIDVNVSYRTAIGTGTVTLLGQASRIESRQRNSSAAPFFDLAGTVFNPPTFRARAGFTLTQGGLSFSPFLNYFGGIRDTRSASAVNGASMATIDTTLIFDLGAARGPLSNLALSLSVQNLMDERPPYLRNVSASVVNYDSTNYSAIGRFVSLAVTKRW